MGALARKSILFEFQIVFSLTFFSAIVQPLSSKFRVFFMEG
jgi:hypothetical protein